MGYVGNQYVKENCTLKAASPRNHIHYKHHTIQADGEILASYLHGGTKSIRRKAKFKFGMGSAIMEATAMQRLLLGWAR